MWEALGISFVVLFFAELGDKTQLTLIALSARYHRVAVLAGAVVAFAGMTALAVTLGVAGAAFLPTDVIRWASGLAFLLIGGWMLWRRFRPRPQEKEEPLDASNSRHRGFVAALFATMLLEMGDKTQLATIALAARYDEPFVVFAGAFLALATVSGLAVVVGSLLAARLKQDWIELVAAILFLVVGILVLVVP